MTLTKGDILIHKESDVEIEITAVTTQLILFKTDDGVERSMRKWDLEYYEKKE